MLIELMSCEELHAILHLVLQAGNIMNAVSLFCSRVCEGQKSATARISCPVFSEDLSSVCLFVVLIEFYQP